MCQNLSESVRLWERAGQELGKSENAVIYSVFELGEKPVLAWTGNAFELGRALENLPDSEKVWENAGESGRVWESL